MGRKYSKECKEDAVSMAAREKAAAAREKLGVVKRLIYDWRRDQRLTSVRIPKGHRTGENIEEGNSRLEKECDELREANYILKKAMSFCMHGLHKTMENQAFRSAARWIFSPYKASQ